MQLLQNEEQILPNFFLNCSACIVSVLQQTRKYLASTKTTLYLQELSDSMTTDQNLLSHAHVIQRLCSCSAATTSYYVQ